MYIRDSGILHALLNIESMEDLFAHPVYGSSFEGYIIENIISRLPRWETSYYRTSNGAEIDLVLTKGMQKIAVEIKSSASAKLKKNFWNCIDDISPDRTVVIAPVDSTYPIADQVIGNAVGLFPCRLIS